MSIIKNDYTETFIQTIYEYFCNSIYNVSSYLNIENIYICDNLNEDIKMFVDDSCGVIHKGVTILPN